MDPDNEVHELHLLHEHDALQAKTQILHKLLLDSIQSRDIKTFKSLVDQGLRKRPPILNVNYVFPDRSDETLLDITCKAGLPDFVQYLLEKGARVNRVNKAHNRAPIHFATEGGYVDVLRVLLDEATVNPNLEAGQQTALHIAVKKHDHSCAEVLLEMGSSPNIPNSKGITALHMAAMKKQAKMVKLIINKCRHTVALDKYTDYNGQTTRQVLTKNLPDIPLPDFQTTEASVHDLKYYLNANDEVNFLKCLAEVEEALSPEEAGELIEMATARYFPESVRVLLDKVRRTGCNLESTVRLAIQRGRPDILQALLNIQDETEGDFILDACSMLGMPEMKGTGDMSDRVECLRLLLEREDADVRCTDGKGNTPLHYAARAGSREAIKLLLEKGSYIGHRNNFGVPPVADITAPTLSEYFDGCLEAKYELGGTNEYSIEFNYRCLMPHNTSYDEPHEPKGEMDLFRYIAHKNTLKHLLQHPLLSSFLYLKWRRVRYLHRINFGLYLFFCILVNWCIVDTNISYIQGRRGMNESEVSSSELETSSDIPIWLKSLTAVALFFYAVREILQLIAAPCHYFRSFRNWIELLLMGLGVAVLSGAGTAVSAITTLVSAWELVILMGQFPAMSTGIEMFKTVSFNFIQFLSLYALLILAFALAFFTLFKDQEEFTDAGLATFKTIVMLSGEFEAMELPYNYHPILSRLVFVLFVLFIAIVLFNLLNGLAVSDTAEILREAELIGLISRTNLIAYVENFAVRPPLIHGSCLCRQSCHLMNLSPLKSQALKTLLFPSYLKNGRLRVKPRSYFGFHDIKGYSHRHAPVFCEDEKEKMIPTATMESNITQQARIILTKRDSESDTERIISALQNMTNRLSVIESTLNNVKLLVDNNNLNSNGQERMDSSGS